MELPMYLFITEICSVSFVVAIDLVSKLQQVNISLVEEVATSCKHSTDTPTATNKHSTDYYYKNNVVQELQ